MAEKIWGTIIAGGLLSVLIWAAPYLPRLHIFDGGIVDLLIFVSGAAAICMAYCAWRLLAGLCALLDRN